MVRPVTGGYVDGKPVVVGELRVHEELFTRRGFGSRLPGRELVMAIRRKTSEEAGMAAVREVRASLRRSVRQSASLQMCMPKASTC